MTSRAQPAPARSRRRPVSCHFCRTRKLRCSRTSPCTNCVSRGITCDLEHPVAQPSSAASTSENSEILERLNRLENLLLAQKSKEQGQNGHPPDVAESRPQLGNVYIDQIPSTKIPRGQVVFRTCSVGQVTKAESYIYEREFYPVTNSEISRCIWLPPRAEAQVLLDKFIRVAHHLPYVTHIPSLSSVLEQVYADLNQRRQTQSGQVILLLSIFAAATHSWVQSDCVYGLYSSSVEANAQTSLWIKAAEDVLDVRCRSPKVSIEGVQGAIILGFIAAHLDGLHRYRVLFAMAVVLARDLGLHRIDHPSNASIANTAQAEIGRRVWWYLCASDWAMAARVGGMAEGIYSCHPRQMITKKPLNINDEEVFDGMSRDERSLSQPTAMSYSMQRIRLAEISRSIVDRSPLAMAHTSGLTHDAVMDIDTELQNLVNDVPAFYTMSGAALMETYELAPTQAENIVFQGRTVYVLLYSQRCKLHLPYLARSSEDPAYYLSREICIKYARLIIQSQLWQEGSDVETETRSKFTELLIGVFMACIVLLMDLCINPLSPQYENQREEVFKAFKIIGEAKNVSETSAKFVDSLVHILRKYNVSPVNSIPDQQQQQPAMDGDAQQRQAVSRKEMALDVPEAPGYGESGAFAFPSESQVQSGVSDGVGFVTAAAEAPLSDGEDDLMSYWNDLTQNFEQGIDVGSFDWDNILSELDSSFI